MQASDTSRARRASLAIAGFGIVSHVAAVLLAASRIDGFVAASHPLAVLGAGGVPGAMAFNLFAFVAPGLCAAWCAWRWRQGMGLHAAWAARLASHMLLLAGLAFAAQGVWVLDLEELDGGRSRGHATAWMLWAVAGIAGGAMAAMGLAMRRRFALASWSMACVVVVLAATTGWLALDAGYAQRVGMAAWAAMVAALAAMRAER